MYGYGYGFGNKSGSVTYDPDAQTLFDRWESLGTPASSTRKLYVSNAISQLKIASIWDELDYLYVWAAHSRTAALVDWKRPSVSATVTNAYSGDFLIDNYFKGSSTSSFRISTGFNPGDGGSYKFTQNSGSFGFYSQTHVDENGVDVSAIVGTTGIEILSNVTTFSPSHKNNNNTFRSAPNVTNVGLVSSRRTASNAWSVFRNGYTLQDASNLAPTDVASAVVNQQINLFSRNISGVYTVYSNKRHCYDFMGSGVFDHFTLHNILDKYYLNVIGATPTKRIMFNGNSMTQTSTYTNRVLDSVGRNTFDIMKRGLNANTTPQLATDAITNIFPKQKSFLAKDVFFFFELTNHMNAVSSNATTCYNSLVSYLTDIRTYHPNVKIVVATCLPRLQSGTFLNANRQNDADLYDDATLNGKIRNHLVQDGYADALADCASDPTMGVYSNGVAGVGELNTTYYNVDGIHPTTTGYNLIADTYFIPAITPYI